MRALLLYAPEGGLEKVAQAVSKGLRDGGYQVDQRPVSRGESGPIPVAPYDILCVGSPVFGILKPSLSPAVEDALKRCVRLEGKRVAVFVGQRPFTAEKGLRILMSWLERQGAWVEDFAALTAGPSAEDFGSRLKALKR